MVCTCIGIERPISTALPLSHSRLPIHCSHMFLFFLDILFMFDLREISNINITFSRQGSDVEVAVPANLSKYIEALLAFTTHSSQVRWLFKKLFKWISSSLGLLACNCFAVLPAVFEVMHSAYLGSSVQTWDSFKGCSNCGDGRQIL